MKTKVRLVLLLHENWNEIHRLKDILAECKEYDFEIEYRQAINEGIDCLRSNAFEVVFLSYDLARETPQILSRNPYSTFILIVKPVEYLLLVHTKTPGTEHVLIEGEADKADIINVLKAKNILPDTAPEDLQQVFLGNLSVPVSISTGTQPDCMFTFVNSALATLLGHSIEEIKNKPIHIMFGKGFKEKDMESLTHALAEKKPWQGEILCTKKNGEKFWNFISVDPVFDEENNFLYFTWLHQDITQNKNEKKSLEARNEELRTFMYRSSHDMRGPLNSNIGLLSLMKQETENENFRYYLELMEKSLTKLNENLLELVELTRIRQGVANIQEVNIKQVVNNVTSHYTNRPELKNLYLNVDIADHVVLNSDHALITSILQNLIENSIKYRDTTKDVCTVVISSSSTEKGVSLTIQDNGIGIPEVMQSKVFDMFFRANTKTEGSGLGLYIVKNCLEKLYGSCSFTSKEGIGTTFELHLPDMKVAQTEQSFEYA